MNQTPTPPGAQPDTIDAYRELFPAHEIVASEGDELRGPRSILWDAFQKFCSHYRHVIMVNADTVFFRSDLILEALERLKSHDVVLGPCRNGGIYLIAMKQPVDLFTSLRASANPRYYEETLDILRGLGLSHSLLEPLCDLDTVEDVEIIDWQKGNGWYATRRQLATLNLLPLSRTRRRRPLHLDAQG